MTPLDERSLSRGHWLFISAIFFLSGGVSLVYQVLWMKELRLLFGSTAHATATTLTAFFLGLALGGWVGGRIAARVRHPLRIYGLLELCIAACALLYFLLFDLYAAVYPAIYREIGHQRETMILVKFLLGIVMLLPASFFMGGTLPVLGQHMVRGRRALGRAGSALYAVNTMGAALGAYAAGFYLPPVLGFDRTYLLAIGINVVLGLAVLLAARSVTSPPNRFAAEAPGSGPGGGSVPLAWSRVRTLAFATGFITLALEVLWVHMFAQVLHNSVYTFAIILITFLAALALGSALAHGICRRQVFPLPVVMGLLGGGGLLVGVSPHLFCALTGGLRYLGTGENWIAYQIHVFGLAAAVIFLPTLLLGTVFPYLMKLSEGLSTSAGRTLGNLAAINTVGAILGSLIAGFVLLGTIGLWSSIRLAAVLALLAILVATPGFTLGSLVRRDEESSPHGETWPVPVAVGAGIVVLFTVLGVARLPLVHVGERERLLATWQGSAGLVAVVEGEGNLRIKVDNHYAVGGSASVRHERRQGSFPLLVHPTPRDVFFLGMGTGITAGAAMDHPVERITVCELVPDAIVAAKMYFGPYTSGLFEDPRAEVLAEDGRTFLRATGRTFDVIISDLFVPWKAGAGSLYTREHFAAGRDHLNPGGLFAQWIPLYQISEEEFAVIARTMLDVFPLVTVWRGDFFETRSIMVLIGHEREDRLDPEAVTDRLRETPDPNLLTRTPALSTFLLSYCGNLTQAAELVSASPVNTDDRPLIEYRAPITHRRALARETRWFLMEDLIGFYRALQETVPPEKDPYLEDLDPLLLNYVRAGLLVHTGRVLREAGKEEEAEAVSEELKALLGSILQP